MSYETHYAEAKAAEPAAYASATNGSPPELAVLMDRLASTRLRIADRFDLLESRLGPVLTPHPTLGSSVLEQKQPLYSPLGQTVAKEVDLLEYLADRLDAILSSLAV